MDRLDHQFLWLLTLGESVGCGIMFWLILQLSPYPIDLSEGVLFSSIVFIPLLILNYVKFKFE